MIRGGFRLTGGEADQFRNDGFLVLRRVLDLSLPEAEPGRLFSENPIILSVAGELLGHGLVGAPGRVRALAPAAPSGFLRRRRIRGDVDRNPFQLGVAGYIEDRPAGGRAMIVWPGSHLDFHSQFFRHVGDGTLPTFAQARERWNSRPGLELAGQAGDAIFFHHRLMHSPGGGRAGRSNSVLLTDFSVADLARTLHESPPADMWWYWPGLAALLRERDAELAALTGPVVPAATRWQGGFAGSEVLSPNR